jgi:hypothetical protein
VIAPWAADHGYTAEGPWIAAALSLALVLIGDLDSVGSAQGTGDHVYRIVSYFANEVLWLNVADPDIINDVSSRKDRFEAAFFIVQWFLTLFMLTAVSVVLYFKKAEGEGINKVCISLNKVHPMKLSELSAYSSQFGYFDIGAAAVLCY